VSGGTFSKANRPTLAGTYFDFAVAQPAALAPSIGSIVALGITHNWGPFKKATLCTSLNDFIAQFGGDLNNPDAGLTAVYEAFKGEGLPDFGGAGSVIVYRMGGSTAAKATKTLQNTTPAAALVLTAKYEGTRGNALALTTQDHASDPTMNELLVIDTTGGGSVVLETFVYLDTNIADLAAQINGSSDYLTATSSITGVALAAVSSVALIGGDDGTTLITGDYTTAMTALEIQRFGVLSFQNLTDSAIQTSLRTWVQGQNAVGRRFFLVVGGILDEVIGAAVTRSGILNDPDIINVGVGSVADNDLLDVNGNPIVLSTAQLAPRIAGIVAHRGERMSLTFAKLAGLSIINGPSASDIAKAYDAGVLVLSRSSDALATVHVEKGISTFTTKTDLSRPKAIFSVPRYLAVMHGVQTDLVLWADENIIGKTTVDGETRAAVLAYTNTLLRERQRVNAVQPGWSAFIDPSPPASDSDDFIAIVLAAKFGRSTEQVYFTAQLG
jgi:hypothetical protein